MDKSTLSNYGWIVIAVLVLAVMIALATPFGTYIKSGVENTTQGLFDTSEKAMNVVGMSAELSLKTESGSYLVLDDVSTRTHNLKIHLSSDTVTDFSGVSVSRYGSNLLDMSKLLTDSVLTDNGDGTYTFTKGSTIYSNYYDVFIPQGTPVYTSVNIIENNLSQGTLYVSYKFEDGTRELKSATNVGANTYTFDKNIVGVAFMVSSTANQNGETCIFTQPQLNIGGKLEYQGYIDVQTVTATADGSATGLTSKSPNVTLITNNSDVTITCEYEKKN